MALDELQLQWGPSCERICLSIFFCPVVVEAMELVRLVYFEADFFVHNASVSFVVSFAEIPALFLRLLEILEISAAAGFFLAAADEVQHPVVVVAEQPEGSAAVESWIVVAAADYFVRLQHFFALALIEMQVKKVTFFAVQIAK